MQNITSKLILLFMTGAFFSSSVTSFALPNTHLRPSTAKDGGIGQELFREFESLARDGGVRSLPISKTSRQQEVIERFREWLSFGNSRVQAGYLAETFRKYRNTEAPLVAYSIHEEGQLAAILFARMEHEFNRDVWIIDFVEIQPQFSGKGYGKRLAQAFVDDYGQRHVMKAEISYQGEREGAKETWKSFWDELGFSKVSELIDYSYRELNTKGATKDGGGKRLIQTSAAQDGGARDAFVERLNDLLGFPLPRIKGRSGLEEARELRASLTQADREISEHLGKLFRQHGFHDIPIQDMVRMSIGVDLGEYGREIQEKIQDIDERLQGGKKKGGGGKRSHSKTAPSTPGPSFSARETDKAIRRLLKKGLPNGREGLETVRLEFEESLRRLDRAIGDTVRELWHIYPGTSLQVFHETVLRDAYQGSGRQEAVENETIGINAAIKRALEVRYPEIHLTELSEAIVARLSDIETQLGFASDGGNKGWPTHLSAKPSSRALAQAATIYEKNRTVHGRPLQEILRRNARRFGGFTLMKITPHQIRRARNLNRQPKSSKLGGVVAQRRKGTQFAPIVIAGVNSEGKLVILDGNHRLIDADQNRLPIYAYVGNSVLDDVKAALGTKDPSPRRQASFRTRKPSGRKSRQERGFLVWRAEGKRFWVGEDILIRVNDIDAQDRSATLHVSRDGRMLLAFRMNTKRYWESRVDRVMAKGQDGKEYPFRIWFEEIKDGEAHLYVKADNRVKIDREERRTARDGGGHEFVLEQDFRTLESIYDELAPGYAEALGETAPGNVGIYRQDFLNLIRGVQGPILDAGTGPGREAGWFYAQGREVIGIDLSRNMIQEAQRRHPDISFLQMDIRNLSFPDHTFSGIWDNMVFIHVLDRDAEQALEEYHRTLVPGGALFLHIVHGDGVQLEQHPIFPGIGRLSKLYLGDEIRNLVEATGFEILEMGYEPSTFEHQEGIYLFARRLPVPSHLRGVRDGGKRFTSQHRWVGLDGASALEIFPHYEKLLEIFP